MNEIDPDIEAKALSAISRKGDGISTRALLQMLRDRVAERKVRRILHHAFNTGTMGRTVCLHMVRRD